MRQQKLLSKASYPYWNSTQKSNALKKRSAHWVVFSRAYVSGSPTGLCMLEDSYYYMLIAWSWHEYEPEYTWWFPKRWHRHTPKCVHSLLFSNFDDNCRLCIVRQTRVQIIRLRNDWKELMSRIEKGLHEVHASYASNKVAGKLPVSSSSYGQSVNEDNNSQNSNDIEPAFARISEVFRGAPAETAGLKAEDRITRFGNINWMNHEKLSKVAETVQRNEGVS